MTALWAWADLGDHALQRYNIKQYWLVMSVLSVKKFNPEWKRVFIVDQVTADYIRSRNWDHLWDEIRVVDFKDTEYGNLYDIKIYSWPKLYSYGLIDDDLLVLDIDIVFIKKFIIPDQTVMCGQFYDGIHQIKKNYNSKCSFTFRGEWHSVMKKAVEKLDFYELALNYRFDDTDICITGSPVYVPKGLGKHITKELIEHIIELETLDGRIKPKLFCECFFFAFEEEFPLAAIGRRCRGKICCFDRMQYKHGFTQSCKAVINMGFKSAEKLIGEPIFEKYIKINEDH